MRKIICDVCGKETDKNYVEKRLQRRLGDFRVGVLVGYGEDDGTVKEVRDICLECVLKIINDGEEVK